MPRRPKKQRTPAQLLQQDRFRAAAAYRRSVARDPERSAWYRQVAERRRRTIYQIAMADYLAPPVIAEIDLAAYDGRPGDVIGVCARDDTQVTAGDIVLRDGEGVIKEQGPAEYHGPGWCYRPRTSSRRTKSSRLK